VESRVSDIFLGGLFASHLGLSCRVFQNLNTIRLWMFKNFWTRVEVVTWWNKKIPVRSVALASSEQHSYLFRTWRYLFRTWRYLFRTWRYLFRTWRYAIACTWAQPRPRPMACPSKNDILHSVLLIFGEVIILYHTIGGGRWSLTTVTWG
jgi:hypothetical protein